MAAVNREDFQEAIVKIGRVTKVVKGGSVITSYSIHYTKLYDF